MFSDQLCISSTSCPPPIIKYEPLWESRDVERVSYESVAGIVPDTSSQLLSRQQLCHTRDSTHQLWKVTVVPFGCRPTEQVLLTTEVWLEK